LRNWLGLCPSQGLNVGLRGLPSVPGESPIVIACSRVDAADGAALRPFVCGDNTAEKKHKKTQNDLGHGTLQKCRGGNSGIRREHGGFRIALECRTPIRLRARRAGRSNPGRDSLCLLNRAGGCPEHQRQADPIFRLARANVKAKTPMEIEGKIGDMNT
jgi:hypothetical protein